ncbi:MAG TPA: hypothetical protein PLN33_08090 [Hyphomonadaceae bacterium]|nr:hypothetical protein [Hyphomonadaceae bacterium]HPN07213.1 hypothetical protein [Hyphomonadaceae bacterium]
MSVRISFVLPVVLALAACATGPEQQGEAGRAWLAGDHHVHSKYSVGWKPDPANPNTPPEPIIAGDAIYDITVNALMAREHGLSWMVATDHGGPNHSKLTYEKAYPDLQIAREQVADLIQFYGMEFDTPGADHSSMIIPHTAQEREALRDIESKFSKREPWPADPSWNTEPRMIDALNYMRGIDAPPVVIANHPSRSAPTPGGYGQDTPAELRGWNNTAPNVAIGMEGAPGHQAGAINPDGSNDPKGERGGYDDAPTMGGFDAMTAKVGGFWDSMLGEGRRWWVTSTSDSHRHWKDGGNDFWPGEYSKTYVYAHKDYDDVLAGLRAGRIFVTTGDLISELDVTAKVGGASAAIGGELSLGAARDVTVMIRVRDPAGQNHGGKSPEVARIDLIAGDVTGPLADPTVDRNPSTRVVKRFTAADWKRDGEVITLTYVLKGVSASSYIRVRGTNTDELEPTLDPLGEDPWSDLWFYSNPIFLKGR